MSQGEKDVRAYYKTDAVNLDEKLFLSTFPINYKKNYFTLCSWQCFAMKINNGNGKELRWNTTEYNSK